MPVTEDFDVIEKQTDQSEGKTTPPGGNSTISLDTFSDWIGRTVECVEAIEPPPARRMSSWLDRDDPEPKPGDLLPPGWHSIYFLSSTPTRELGAEGGTPHGNLVPPLPLQREMWVGSRLSIARPLKIGETAKRIGMLKSLTSKIGRSGPLVFVTLRDEYHDETGLAVSEEIDLIFREDVVGQQVLPPPQARPGAPQWARSIVADTPLLFRYSALTYNSHRIHYDYRYTTEREGYPGLLVAGPMQSLLMLDLVRRNDPRSIRDFTCRAVRPIFEGGPFSIEGRLNTEPDRAELWTVDNAGAVGMTATLTFA